MTKELCGKCHRDVEVKSIGFPKLLPDEGRVYCKDCPHIKTEEEKNGVNK